MPRYRVALADTGLPTSDTIGPIIILSVGAFLSLCALYVWLNVSVILLLEWQADRRSSPWSQRMAARCLAHQYWRLFQWLHREEEAEEGVLVDY
jgi:hypothetical protein